MESLEGMLQQRIDIGLERETDSPRPSLPLQVVPVVAIEDPPHDKALDRLGVVQDRLRAAGVAEPELEVWRVSPSVKIVSRLAGA